MRNHKTWGVLGKRQTFLHPSDIAKSQPKVPLNANPLDPWDAKKSKFRRVDLMPRDVSTSEDSQQGGVVPQVSSTPVPDVSPTPTPSFTPTMTQTPTSTPYILPETPALWYDSTNVGSIDYISSGGTDYVQTWRSIGTYQKALSGVSTNTMPVWTGSSQLPGSPLIVKFNKNATATLRDYLTQRFDNTIIPNSGMTVFYVVANPGLSYSVNISNIAGFGFNFYLLSGNTTTGGFTPLQGTISAPTAYNIFVNNTLGTINAINVLDGIQVNNTITNYSATSLNDKFIYTQVYPYPTGYPYFELNQSGGTNSLEITGGTSYGINAVNLGAFTNSGGTITAVNAGVEVAEIMVFNRELSPSEQEQVQDYLRDKWRYDEWASPVPTATPTGTPTQTPTQTTTMTPSPSPSAPASGTTEAIAYLNKVVSSGGTVDATASAATITLFTSLVSNGLWDKIYAMYPVLGGVAASHAIDARSTIYELTFNGGWTHTSSGMQPNGTNGYANGLFNPQSVIGNGNSSHLSVYVNKQGAGDRVYDIGNNSSDSLLTDQLNLTAKRSVGTGNNTLFDAGNYDPSAYGRVSTTSQASASGMTVGSVRSTTDRTLYRDGSNIATQTNSRNITYTNSNIYIGAQNSGGIGANYFSDNQYAFITIGSGLTNTEIVNLSSIINTYQTSLGRNTY